MEVRHTHFQSLGRDKQFLDGNDLKEIKQKLLSANKDQIMEAVEKIKIFMCSEEFAVYLIKADICEFLCDAVSPSDGIILENIYSCLGVMSKYIQFYSHSHSCFTIESIIRSLYFLLKNPHNISSVGQCFNLLIFILQGHLNHSIIPEKKAMRNLLELIMLMVKLDDMTPENKFQIGNLLLTIINLNTLKWCYEFYNAVLSCSYWWFISVSLLLQSVHPLKEKLILLCCSFSYSLLSCIVTEKSIFQEFNSQSDSNVKNNVIIQISHFLVKIGVSYFDNEFWNHMNKDFTYLEFFYQALLFYCNNEIPFQKKYVMHGISERGFIQLTTKIITFPDQSAVENLQKLCWLVLFQLIMILSEDAFNFPDVWPNGHQNFQDVIQEGMSEIPTNASEWWDVLANPNSSNSCKLTLLLYLYFYVITAKREMCMVNIYPSVVNFIIHSFDLDSPALIIKILWFVFVMSELSKSQYSFLNSGSQAADKLMFSLETQQNLTLVYTHHPAVLYWTFSSNVKCNIQFQIVQLWLLNKTQDCRELEGLIEKSSHVRFIVLDILLKGEGKVLDLAFSSLKVVLTENQNAELAFNVWYLLPQVLAKYSTGSISAKNIDYLIELSSLKSPISLDAPKMVRIADLLPEVIFSSSLISIVSSLKLIYQLLQLGSKMDDSRVVFAFVQSENFVRGLLEKCITNTSEVSLYVVRIFTHLWKCGRDFEEKYVFRKIIFSKETLIKIFENESIEVSISALEFLQEVLGTRFRCNFFEITDIDLNFLEVMFFEVENICMKNIPEISRPAWLCLKLFLELEDFHQDLATSPLLHELIKFHLPNLKNYPEMKDFLLLWMDENKKMNENCCFERRIFGRIYLETVQAVAQNGVTNNEEDRILLEKIIQAGAILQEKQTTTVVNI